MSERRRDGEPTGLLPVRMRRVLPAGWCDGWLVFQPSDGGAAGRGGDGPPRDAVPAGLVRRLAPVPADWQTCPDDQLAAYLRAARPGRPPTVPRTAGAERGPQ